MILISGYRSEMNPETDFADNESYLSVNCCGYEKYITKDVKTFRAKGRRDYQLIYIVNGSGSFGINGTMTEVPGGSIVIFRPGEVQQYSYHHNNSPELYWIHFTGAGCENYLKKVSLWNNSISNIGVQSTFSGLFRKIMQELQLKQPLYMEAANAGIMELLAIMGRKGLFFAAKGNKIIDENIHSLLEKLHYQYNKPWTIEEMAGHCSLSANGFMHKFKYQTGFSAVEYIIGIRIDKAKDLLINSSMSIKEISNLVGYENPLYFSRLFSKMAGVPPREYRKKMR